MNKSKNHALFFKTEETQIPKNEIWTIVSLSYFYANMFIIRIS